jgi:tripartite ATP-independent transporter DctM subunit
MLLTVFICSFLILMLLGSPLAFSMLLSSFIYLMVRGGLPATIIIERMSSGLNSFPLLAIPLFILAGRIMNTGGITRRIFNFCLGFVGHLRAGLAYVNVLASIIFAGITGSSAADVAGLGAVEIKTMKEEGYDSGFSASITAASSCIGPIIPPSIVMIVIGVISEVSIGKLFAGGLIPGLLMGFAMMMVIFYYTLHKKEYFPAPAPKATFKERLKYTKEGLPSVLSPVIILGGILTGIVTPTESGVIAVIYSLVLGFIYKEIKFKDLFNILKDSALSTGLVMFVIVAAQMFGWVVTMERVAYAFNNFIHYAALPNWLVLLMINLIVLILGCFIEGTAAIMIVVPVFLPIIKSIGLDPIHFGVFLSINTMIGLLTPPVGMSIYIASDLAGVSSWEVFKKSAPFSFIIVVILLLTTYIPTFSMWLPNLMFGK